MRGLLDPRPARALLALVPVLLAGCGGDDAGGGEAPGAGPPPARRSEDLTTLGRVDLLDPPAARRATAEELRADLAAERHPSDGGGRGELVPDERGPARIRASGVGGWTLRFVVGPEGIAEGGSVFFMPEVFWGWTAPQTRAPERPGFTRVDCRAPGVRLELETLPSMVRALVAEGYLAEGDELWFEYGVEGPGARADLYADAASRLWFSVDGDGDGVRSIVVDSPAVEVVAGPPEMLVLTLPSTAAPGAEPRLVAALLDGMGNTEPALEGALELELADPQGGWELPAALGIPAAGGRASLRLPPVPAGVHRLRGRVAFGERVLEAESNPLRVGDGLPAVRWGDLHGHSGLSDGTGTPRHYYEYARDVAGLDFAALTDHDHYGVRFLDQSPELWEGILATVADFHEDGRFVALPGYEWTSWIHGHRHVVYFAERGEVHGALGSGTETPRELWEALRGEPALTFAHHSAGNPVPVNWSFAPDPELEPVTEIVSVHGSSEALDSPMLVRGAIPGNTLRDVLDHGHRLGFIGSGDSHDGHPGLPHLNPTYFFRRVAPGPSAEAVQLGNGGLAAVVAPELTRAALREALQARRCWATSGPRILLDLRLAGHPMGAEVAAVELPRAPRLAFSIHATGALAGVDVVRSGKLLSTRGFEEPVRDLDAELELEPLAPGEYLYLRVRQKNRGLAWTSPIFVR